MITTSAPSFANKTAIDLPIPELPPVTTATCPSSFQILYVKFFFNFFCMIINMNNL